MERNIYNGNFETKICGKRVLVEVENDGSPFFQVRYDEPLGENMQTIVAETMGIIKDYAREKLGIENPDPAQNIAVLFDIQDFSLENGRF